MLFDYYININPQPNGDHEVHKSDCGHLPLSPNAIYLGKFANCYDAISKAKERGYNTADGCYYCCKPCHKQ